MSPEESRHDDSSGTRVTLRPKLRPTRSRERVHGEFESRWNELTEEEQKRIEAVVNPLRREGTALRYSRGLIGAESGGHVIHSIPCVEPDCPRTAPHVEIALGRLLQALPAQAHRLGAPLAAHEADGLPLDDLGRRVDAGASAGAETVADGLGEMRRYMSSFSRRSCSMPSTVRSVGDADQEVAALGVEEGGDGLEGGLRDVPMVLAVFSQVPAQARFKFEGLPLLELQQLLDAAVAPDVVVEEVVIEGPGRSQGRR
ncbi:MAG: hypothetical protein OXF93_10855 [Acidobacteria bacterium]|nr:hypothetical protein [Acidobacteriota bacterium]